MPYNIIRSPGQNSLIADQNDDTLDIIAGPGILVTTNAAIDAITITATGGGIGGGLGFTGSSGFTGSKGLTGGLGDIGYSGSTGSTGYTGSAGDLGYSGSRGMQGYAGSQGVIGLQGDLGFTGSEGGLGFTGSRGFGGYAGSVGNLGFTGSVGLGETGFTGSIGALGYTGSGSLGFTGSVGGAGPAGPQGFTGSVGAGASIAVNDEGNILTSSATTINFVGAGVTAEASGNTVNVTIPGSSTGSEIVNGSSNVVVDANSVVRVSVTGTANVLTIGDSNTFVTGNLIPSQSNTYSLGTPDLRWKDLYVSANSISIGDVLNSVTLSASNTGQLQLVSAASGSQDPSILDSNVSVIVTCTGKNTAVTVTSDVVDFRMPRKIRVTDVRASLSTAQTSGNRLTVDVKKNGVSILSTKLSFDNSEKSTKTSSVPRVIIPNTIIDDDDEVSFDVIQVGDGTAKGLKVQVNGSPVN